MHAKNRSRGLHKAFKELFVLNVYLNGLKAAFYCFGLSSSRYIEYTKALVFLSPELNQGDIILDIGCGHSILPILWNILGFNAVVVAIDLNQNALKWQIEKSKEKAKKSSNVVLADGKYLPFRDEAVSAISCISSIEHLPEEGDTQVAYEAGRVLKPGGLCVVSFPASPYTKGCSRSGLMSGIPPFMKRLLRFFLPVLFKKFNVDRTSSYFERFYNVEDVHKRIITPSGCIAEEWAALKGAWIIEFINDKLVPGGVLTPLEYLVAKFLAVGTYTENAGAFILKLRKPSTV